MKLQHLLASSLRAARIAVPAFARHLAWPLVKWGIKWGVFGGAVWAVIAISRDVATAILSQGNQSWSAVLTAKSVSALLCGSATTLVSVLVGWTPLSRRGIAASWILNSAIGFTLHVQARGLGDELLFDFDLAVLVAAGLIHYVVWRRPSIRSNDARKELTRA